jgi:hypothetical protein
MGSPSRRSLPSSAGRRGGTLSSWQHRWWTAPSAPEREADVCETQCSITPMHNLYVLFVARRAAGLWSPLPPVVLWGKEMKRHRCFQCKCNTSSLIGIHTSSLFIRTPVLGSTRNLGLGYRNIGGYRCKLLSCLCTSRSALYFPGP